MSWLRHASGATPPPIGGHASILLGNIILISCGNADVRGLPHRENIPGYDEAIATKRTTIDERNVLQNRTWVLYLDSMKWAELTEITGPVPSPRYSHTIGYVEQERLICLFGGFANNEAQSDVHFLYLDVEKWSWNTATWHGTVPQARYGHTINVVGNLLYAYGGAYKNAVLGDVVPIHCSRISNSATVLPAAGQKGKVPPPRAYHSAVVIQSRFILVFGGRGTGNLPLGDLHAFDTLTGEWHELSPKGTGPSPRYNHSASVTKSGKVIIFGGFDGKVFLSDTHVLDIDSLTWSQPAFTGSGPSARSRHSAICTGNRVCVFGGTDDQRKMNDLHVLDMGYWEEVNKCYQRMQFLCGNNLELLPLNELEDLEELYITGLRKVSSMRKRKQEEAHQNTLAALRLQLAQQMQPQLPSIPQQLSTTGDPAGSTTLPPLQSSVGILGGFPTSMPVPVAAPPKSPTTSRPSSSSSASAAAPSVSLLSDETYSSASSSPSSSRASIIRQRGGSPPPSAAAAHSLTNSVSSLNSSIDNVAPGGSTDESEGSILTRENAGGPSKKKRLQFGNVEVRTMNREPGEGVPREGGAPLGLGWNVVEHRVLPLNSFEEERTKRRVPKYALLGWVPESAREILLLNAGVSKEDLARERRSVEIVQSGRAESNSSVDLSELRSSASLPLSPVPAPSPSQIPSNN